MVVINECEICNESFKTDPHVGARQKCCNKLSCKKEYKKK